MIDFTVILRFICILISLFGASVFIRQRTGIHYAFCMSITCSFIVTILFLASLFMRITAVIWILFGIGILMFIYELIRREIHKDDILNWTNLFLLIGIVVLFAYLAGHRLIFIDDYTHWGVITRHLVENRSLPDASDFLVTFPSYVPGSALWITYVATLTGGTTEDLYLIAQAFLILVFFTPLTGCSFRKPYAKVLPICALIITMAFCAVTMTFSATILSLCVDGLLAASALAGIFFLILSDASLNVKAWFLIPLMFTVMAIKTAGLLCAAAQFAILLYLFIRDKKRGALSDKRGSTIAGVIAAPVICIVIQLLWQWHVRVAFPEAGGSMHALSIARWKEVYESRGAELIQTILKEFFRKITLWYLVLFIVALIVLYLFLYICGRKTGHRIARQSLWMLLLSLVHYVIYLGSMLFVYLFSMSEGEASFLAAFDRYMWVELIYLVGLCLCFLFRLFCHYEDGFGENAEEKAVSRNANVRFRQFAIRHGNPIRLVPLVLMAIGSVAFLLFFWIFGPKYDSLDYQHSTIGQINELSPEDYTGDVLIYAPSQMDVGYDESLLLYFGRFKFRSPEIRVATFERGNVESYLSMHTHIYIAEPDDQIKAYLRGQGWTCDIVPGLYDIERKALEE